MTKANCGHNEICQKQVFVEATRCEICGILHLKFETTEPFTIKDQSMVKKKCKHVYDNLPGAGHMCIKCGK